MSSGSEYHPMRNEVGKIERTQRPVGTAQMFADAVHAPIHTAPISGAMSTQSRAGVLPSKGTPRAARMNMNLDVVQLSNAIVPGYTTPVVSLLSVVQDETDIPVADAPSLMGSVWGHGWVRQ